MSMTANIVRTIFQSIDSDGSVSSTTYGFRIYDDLASSYCNVYQSLEELIAISPEDLVDEARKLDPAASAIVDFAIQLGHPIFVDDLPVMVS